MSMKDRARIVEDVTSILGLSDVADSLIGDENVRGISGGQRKRVNVGIELVAQPSVLLLDEPTSGLDSGGSMELIRVLRQLADDRGITVAAVVHQPSFGLISLFDSIVLLSKGGRIAYAGPVKAMKSYFEELGFVFPSGENAVDVCLDAVSGLKTSANPAVTVKTIPEIWLKRGESGTASSDGSVQNKVGGLEPDEAESDDESSDAVNNLELLEQPLEQSLPNNVGGFQDFWRLALASFVFPPLSLVPFYSTRFRSRYGQMGAVGGASTMLIFSMIVMFIVFPSISGLFTDAYAGLFFNIFVLTFGSLNIFIAGICLIATIVSRLKPFSLSILAHFQMGVALGPFLLPAVFLFREKLRYAARLGFGMWLVALGVVFGTGFVIVPFYRHGPPDAFIVTAPILYAEFFLLFFPTVGFSYMAVSAIRWNHLPSSGTIRCFVT